MKVNLYDLTSQKIDQISLKKEVFASKINQDLISQAVRVYLFNQRKANPLAKGRSQVAGSTRKIWAQKGTGRARHSDTRAPLFVGGGVAQLSHENCEFYVSTDFSGLSPREIHERGLDPQQIEHTFLSIVSGQCSPDGVSYKPMYSPWDYKPVDGKFVGGEYVEGADSLAVVDAIDAILYKFGRD